MYWTVLGGVDFHFSRDSKSGKIVAGDNTQTVQLKREIFSAVGFSGESVEVENKAAGRDTIIFIGQTNTVKILNPTRFYLIQLAVFLFI